jgi:hypothetical protein
VLPSSGVREMPRNSEEGSASAAARSDR